MSELSLTMSDTESSNVPSAGIFSPASTSTMSPTTMSRRGTWVMAPLRITFTGMSSLNLLSISNFLFALNSRMKPITVASIIATKMPAGSRNTCSPLSSENTS